MSQPTGGVGPASRGTRSPEIAAALANGAVPVSIDLEAEHAGDAGAGDDERPDLAFVRTGDIVTISVTLPVILPGDTKEAYFGAKHTTRALPGEGDNEVYGRVGGNVISTVMATIKDTIAAIEEELTNDNRLINAGRGGR